MRRDIRKKRREAAEARDALRAKRTPEEQLALLDRRLGEGVGAARERERLSKLIAKRPAEPQDCQGESSDNTAAAARKTPSRKQSRKRPMRS